MKLRVMKVTGLLLNTMQHHNLTSILTNPPLRLQNVLTTRVSP